MTVLKMQRFDGAAFWQFLLELPLCRRSHWKAAHLSQAPEGGVGAFRTIEIGAGDNPPEQWEQIQQQSERWLPSPGGQGGENA